MFIEKKKNEIICVFHSPLYAVVALCCLRL